MTIVFALLFFAQVSADQPTVVLDDPWEIVPLVPVSQIELPADMLDGKWETSAGLRIDDLPKTDRLPPENRKLVEPLAKQLSPIGVRSVADYSLVQTGFPLNTVTVRLFVFEDAKQCRSWWEKKYEFEGWQEHYERVDCSAAVAVHSLETNKAAMAFGNVWLTTSQIQEGHEHIDSANYVLKQLTDGKRNLSKP